jgi:hypothetical protein
MFIEKLQEAVMKRLAHDQKYKRISVVLDIKRHAQAIEILKNVPPYWRNDFISDAILAHNNKRDDFWATADEGAKANKVLREAKFLGQV